MTINKRKPRAGTSLHLPPAVRKWAALAAGAVAIAGCEGVIGEPVGQFARPGSNNTTGPRTGPDGRFICDDTTYGGPSSARRLTAREYANAISDLLGVSPSANYPGSYGSSVTGYSTEPGINTLGEQGVEHVLYAAEEVAEALAPRLADILPCASSAPNDACVDTFLSTVGRRAFRRTLNDEESALLRSLYAAERADGATFAEAVSVMVAELLQMPAFLYVVEEPASPGVDRRLSGNELATRLALLLWDSVPDDALLDRAESGELDTKQGVLAEAQRMLEDPRSERAVARYFREWTKTAELSLASKDAEAFTYLDAQLVSSINESFDRFVVDQVRSGGTLRSLLTTKRTFVDARLATFMGLSPVSDWTQVELDATRYSGIMTQPGMLAALAHTSETSYVFRGKFVRERLMCDKLGAPPGSAMSEFASIPKPPDPTARELSAGVNAKGACTTCHAALDPPGLAFENFDAMGAYRTGYTSGKPIDTSGTYKSLNGGPEFQFSGPVDLIEKLSGEPATLDCYARNIFRFSAARLETKGDACTIQQLRDALVASDGQLDRVLLEATQSDTFRYRRGD